MNKRMKQKRLRTNKLGPYYSFGDNQDIISFHCFIVTWVILLYASLLWIEGSQAGAELGQAQL